MKEVSLYDAIYKNLSDNGFNVKEAHFRYSMERGGYIIFLDGFDEVNRDKANKISNEIKSVCDKYTDNKYVVSSRPNEGFIGWDDFAEMTALTLTKEQAINLVSKIDYDDEVKKAFCKELDKTLYNKYKSFASNPLLLNIMLLTFNNHASIPDRINDFYEQAFITLFNMHDATKDSYVRDIRSGLGYEDFKLVFAYICFKSYFKDEFEFTELSLRSYIQEAKDKFHEIKFSVENFQQDLTKSVCMLVKDGLTYRFSHRSFQEYFAAWYTCKLTDDIQYKLLSNWIKESPSIMSDSYFKMLHNFQSEKVNKIILMPALKEIKRTYEENGLTVTFLKEFYEAVIIHKELTGEEEWKLYFIVKESYWGEILRLSCKLNGYNRGFTEKSSKLANELQRLLAKNNIDPTGEITFEQILAYVPENTFLNIFKEFEDQVLFALKIIDKYENSAISKKRKVSSIIDEL